MKKKRVLLLGGNFYPEPTGIGKYNGEMMDWFSARGHKCAVITSFPYYPYWKVQAPYTGRSYWYKKESKASGAVPIQIYRCPHYVPSNPSGKKRILSDLSFFISAFFRLLPLFFTRKYDYVIVTAPPFQLGLLGILYQKIKGASFIYHIQDLQIDAAEELGMIKSRFLLRCMYRLEQFILKEADHISTVSEGMLKKIAVKINRKVLLFPNWVDTEVFFPVEEKRSFRASYNFSADDKIILYSGAIGEKQGLDTLLLCAHDLQENERIKFVICGSGPYKEKLIKTAVKHQLHNVFFLPLQNPHQFNGFLNMADVHLVLQKAGASDLMMPSKLSTILSVGGLALVTADAGTHLHEVVATNKLGLLTEPDNRFALTDAILKSINEEHLELKQNARAFAIKSLSTETIVTKFFSQILESEHEKGEVKIFGPEKRVQADKWLLLNSYSIKYCKHKMPSIYYT